MKRITTALQLDGTLGYAMAARVWQALAGPVTIVLLMRYFTASERGIYYVIGSILGIQMFFELGLLNILVSQAGHEAGRLNSEPGKRRMGALFDAAQRWFGWASVPFACTAVAVGWYEFAAEDISVSWRLPLIVLATVSALTIAISPALAILEGAGFRRDVYQVRLWQAVTASLLVWLTLSLGFKLWALVVAASVQLLWSAYLVYGLHRPFFKSLHEPASRAVTTVDTGFSWVQEVLPMQWRQALISVVYHFATQFFPVIIVTCHADQAEAGRLGMTLTVTVAIQSLAIAWMQSKYSLVSAQHGVGQRETAGTLWRRNAVVSTTLLIAALVSLILLISVLPMIGRGWEDGFIDPLQLAILSVGCVANHFLAIEGFYVLSRKGKPFVFASVVGFSSTAIAVWVGGYFLSTTGIVLGYALTLALVVLPLRTYAYLKFRRQTP
ncbi:polysaccharide biosynthesis protein [Aureliella helgolandensis]|uniref:hypothetical protein n=1 Tax=Aureliella helgolandensis TaxID=2527968 RepID=UPI0011A76C46|nr:hypothetical protein [Aureliella helgolandensis]